MGSLVFPGKAHLPSLPFLWAPWAVTNRVLAAWSGETTRGLAGLSWFQVWLSMTSTILLPPGPKVDQLSLWFGICEEVRSLSEA